ncbi:putative quinol monooxygenase [Asticcacaulis solisilvae]|uniref:putative quinol monooxygenase n=1 Tax=Asticcacaulis solisilvae TaxID=1217274 RepID=UPI003FD6EA31
MRLAHVTFTVAPENQSTALDALLAEVASVRHMQGCIAFIPFIDPTVAGGLGVVHEWETGEDFTAYLNSPGFAAVNTVLRPMMTGAPVSRRFDVNLLQPAN